MRRLLLRKLSLISRAEKAAKSVQFDRDVTVILGKNDVGKSSLIKSIYWAFGADPIVIHDRWKTARVTSLVEFTIDGEGFAIVRQGGQFGLFDADGRVVLKTASVTRELGPALAKLLTFDLTLADAESRALTPPPAFCFLPFYVDQDRGWQQGWQSFSSLGQFPNFRRDVISYHSGIRPNEYYKLKSATAEDRSRANELTGERLAVEKALQRMKDRRRLPPINIDSDSYKKSIARILKEIEKLEVDRSKSLAKLSDLTSERALLEEQIAVARGALQELDSDYKFARTVVDETVVCPTCGTIHDNSFTNRFSLIRDSETCRSFLLTATGRSDELSRRVEDLVVETSQINHRSSQLHRLLNEKRGKIQIKDIIESESKRKALDFMQDEIDALNRKVGNLLQAIAQQEQELRKITNKERKEKIDSFFDAKFRRYLDQLNVRNLTLDANLMHSIVRDTGSDQPRALLAYFYAFLHTIDQHSTACFCPVVIDSPNQQDQDEANLHAMLRLILDERPKDAQLVLGTVSLFGVPYSGKTIELFEKDHLLSENEFDATSERIRPFYDQLI